MEELEKVIERLEYCAETRDGYVRDCINDALELLKEQAVEPTFKQDKDGIYVWACGSCGAYMYHIYEGIDKAKEYAKFCRKCGKAVKWDDA